MNQPNLITGAIAVTVTPVTNDYTPNFSEIERQTEWLCQTEISGLFPCSSTGEFTKFSRQEKIDILEVVAKTNSGRKKLVAGAAGANLEEAVLFFEAAERFGYDACVVCPPYYYHQTQDEIFRFYSALAEKAEKTKLILYNVPFFTSEIAIDTVNRLMDYENIIGIKDSSANLKRISHICQLKREDFAVYSGTDDCLLPALVAGCGGSMTALAGIFPEWIASVYQDFRSGNISSAREKQRKILPILRLADSLPFPYGYKLLALCAGTDVGPLPSTISMAQADDVLKEIKKALLDLREGGIIHESHDLGRL